MPNGTPTAIAAARCAIVGIGFRLAVPAAMNARDPGQGRLMATTLMIALPLGGSAGGATAPTA